MLYPMLVEYYVWFGLLLLATTWFTRQSKPETRRNLMYGYGMIVVLGFLLGFDWVAGVIFGLLVLEIGRVFKGWLDKKESQLKK
ncbi:hypothetical protein [Marinomonas sp. IMCC 4694]|uniref:hypothetical protein n=1 Tax=Marinomonas sp. IMCC 4694 TaxID=2605432 RepID=UPI0011E7F6B3|nr:hypothetical protein [Marinomonas sp. IMCC 4694]TYL48273.1 hypothetical protein FXV75_10165 [Marinomonas sp. IMCC 4694]